MNPLVIAALAGFAGGVVVTLAVQEELETAAWIAAAGAAGYIAWRYYKR